MKTERNILSFDIANTTEDKIKTVNLSEDVFTWFKLFQKPKLGTKKPTQIYKPEDSQI
ncbi:MAG: hypothetical protein KDK54_16040 [Leptospiraceae bacterium]|nr:hypothetical protein [Leptospiraceae bacterium]